MFIQSFTTLDNTSRLTGVRNAQTIPYDRFTRRLYDSTVPYPPEYDTERQWFEYQTATLSENGRQHCPYVDPKPAELRLTGHLQQVIPSATSVACKTGGHCYGCGGDYLGEHDCLTSSTGEYSDALSDTNRTAEVTVCAC